MKFLAFIVLSTFMMSTYAGGPAYPKTPDPKLTPGMLCELTETYRYPEHIAYCERGVDSFTKEAIFMDYRKYLGYRLNGERTTFKIDHFIPLCAGGSNQMVNLWPQHISLSEITDPIESKGCEKLSKGMIKQKDLVALIMKAKLDNSQAPAILKYLKKLQ
jgi:hypothetical protein